MQSMTINVVPVSVTPDEVYRQIASGRAFIRHDRRWFGLAAWRSGNAGPSAGGLARDRQKYSVPSSTRCLTGSKKKPRSWLYHRMKSERSILMTRPTSVGHCPNKKHGFSAWCWEQNEGEEENSRFCCEVNCLARVPNGCFSRGSRSRRGESVPLCHRA